jgi:hypothetical protein
LSAGFAAGESTCEDYGLLRSRSVRHLRSWQGHNNASRRVNASPGQVTLGLIAWLSAVVFSVSGDERR